MWKRIWNGVERRKFRRLQAHLRVEVGVELYGFEGRAHPFFASGRTLDISRGGILAHIDSPIHAGAVCNIFFRDPDSAVRPRHVSGRVIRCQQVADDQNAEADTDRASGARTPIFRIAVAFEEPLLQLPPLRRQVALAS